MYINGNILTYRKNQPVNDRVLIPSCFFVSGSSEPIEGSADGGKHVVMIKFSFMG